MNNKLSDLNNHLFAQLERLSDESLKGDELKEEIERSKSVSEISKRITENARTVLDGETLRLEYGLKALSPTMLGLENKQ